jgi:hypothetical protein
MAKRASLKSKANLKAWQMVKGFCLSWKVSIKYAYSYFHSDYSLYFEISFVKKDNSESKRLGSNMELKNGVIIFYSLTDKCYKTAYPNKVTDLKAVNIEVKAV